MGSTDKVIQYSITKKDVLIFEIRGVLRHRLMQIVFVLFLGFLAILPFITPPPPGHPELPLAAKILGGFVLVIIGFIIMSLGFLAISTLHVYTRNLRNVIGQYELKLSDDGMMTRGPTSETLRKWNGLLKVTSTKSYLYLYVTNTSAQIIPKRCFASPAEALSFEAMIRERMKSN